MQSRREGAEELAAIRALYVAYYFPPHGGAGTQRSLKFASHLPSFGIEPVVVTGPGDRRGRWSPRDETLSDEIGAVEVRRVPGPEPEMQASGWAGRRERWLMTRSRWAEWWQRGVVEEAARVDGASVMQASMSPFATAEAAARAAGRLGIPWLAGLRDPWALDEMMAYPTAAHRVVEKRRMRRAIATAFAIVMSTPEAAKRAAAAFPELAPRVISIPNGYDATDFAGPAPPRDDDKFRIVHSGYLHTEAGKRNAAASVRRGLGGEILGVDVSTRTHLYLLDAVRRLISERPELADVIEIHFAGVTTRADRDAASGAGYVHFHEYLPHGESIALIRSADLLFLPMHNLRAGERASIVPGKTYEYLATSNPILAAVPEGDTRDIVRSAGTGLVCNPDDADAMARIIREQIDRWRSGGSPPRVNDEYVRRFERKSLAGELATVMREAIAAAPAKRLTR